MHDPQTVAFEIRYPWKKYGKSGRNAFERSYRESFITIWHVDPEKDGSDDSCDWSGRKRRLNAKEKAIFETMRDLETLLDNRPHFPDSLEHKTFQPLKSAIWELRQREGWRYPVRWHFWHWKFQVHPLQQFKRWAFSKCCKCGKGFKYGESPVGYSWDGTGPLWFRAEKHIAHMSCDRSVGSAAKASACAGRDPQRTGTEATGA